LHQKICKEAENPKIALSSREEDMVVDGVGIRPRKYLTSYFFDIGKGKLDTKHFNGNVIPISI
jgi:hypothetical protein